MEKIASEASVQFADFGSVIQTTKTHSIRKKKIEDTAGEKITYENEMIKTGGQNPKGIFHYE